MPACHPTIPSNPGKLAAPPRLPLMSSENSQEIPSYPNGIVNAPRKKLARGLSS
jgi:hypothetical protein